MFIFIKSNVLSFLYGRHPPLHSLKLFVFLTSFSWYLDFRLQNNTLISKMDYFPWVMNVSHVLLVLWISSKPRIPKRCYSGRKSMHKLSIKFSVPWTFSFIVCCSPVPCGENIFAVAKPPFQRRILDIVSQRKETLGPLGGSVV